MNINFHHLSVRPRESRFPRYPRVKFSTIFTVRPLDVRIIPDEQPLTAQRKYELICESTGSRPPAKLTWWKNNHRLEKTKDTV